MDMIRKGFIWKKTTKSKVRKSTRKKKTKIIEVLSDIIPHTKNSILVCDLVPTEESRAEKKFTLTPQESPRKQNNVFQKINAQKRPEEITRGKHKRAPKEKHSSQKKQKTERLQKIPKKTPKEILLTWENSPLLEIDQNPTKIPHKIFTLNPGKNLHATCLETSSKKKKRNNKKQEDPTKSPKATKKRKRSESEFEKQNPLKKHKQ